MFRRSGGWKTYWDITPVRIGLREPGGSRRAETRRLGMGFSPVPTPTSGKEAPQKVLLKFYVIYRYIIQEILDLGVHLVNVSSSWDRIPQPYIRQIQVCGAEF